MRGELLAAVLLLFSMGWATGLAGGETVGSIEQAPAVDPAEGVAPSIEDAREMLGAAEGACVPSCEIQARAQGYASPTTVIESNTTVTWVSVDADFHTATSTGPDYDRFAIDPCLNRGLSPGAPANATFRINRSEIDPADPDTSQDATLEIRKTKTVTETRIVDGEEVEVEVEVVYWEVCEEAVQGADGAFVLFYLCAVHPTLQKGQLVVVPRI